MKRLIPLTKRLAPLFLGLALLSPAAQAVTFKTTQTNILSLREGLVKMPFTFRYSIEWSKFRAESVMDGYFQRMMSIAKSKVNSRTGCQVSDSSRSVYFLPGTTESDFRAYEKTFVSRMQVAQGNYPAAKLMGQYDFSFPSDKVNGRMYILSAGDNAGRTSYRHIHLFAFMYYVPGKQSIVLGCDATY